MAKKLQKTQKQLGKIRNSEKTYLKRTLCELKGLPSRQSKNNQGNTNEMIDKIRKAVDGIVYDVEHQYPLKEASTLYSIAWKRCLNKIHPKEGIGILGF